MRLGQARIEARLHLPDLAALAGHTADPLDAETVDAVNVGLAPGAEASAVSRALDAALPTLVGREIYGFPFTQPFPDVDRTECLLGPTSGGHR